MELAVRGASAALLGRTPPSSNGYSCSAKAPSRVARKLTSVILLILNLDILRSTTCDSLERISFHPKASKSGLRVKVKSDGATTVQLSRDNAKLFGDEVDALCPRVATDDSDNKDADKAVGDHGVGLRPALATRSLLRRRGR